MGCKSKQLVDLSEATNDNEALTIGQANRLYLRIQLGGNVFNDISLNGSELRNIRRNVTSNDSAISRKYLQDFINRRFVHTALWEIFAEAHFASKLDMSRMLYVTLDNSVEARRIRTINDQSRGSYNAIGSGATSPLLCLKTERVNQRYFAKFDGSRVLRTEIDVNREPINTGYEREVTHHFVCYKIDRFHNPNHPTNHTYVTTALFGAMGPILIGAKC